MAGRLRAYFANEMSHNFQIPKSGFYGWITKNKFVRANGFLEENAVRLSNIKPNHRVLEIGFGPGLGLESAYTVVKNGDGKVYGIDTSFYMVETARRRLKRGISDKKVVLFHGSATNIPLNTDSVNRVFHTNAYYFWPSMRSVMREIYRVMKPGSVMVTTLSIKNLEIAKKLGYLQTAHIDPVKYMACLENYGFENVHLEYHKDPVTGKEFQAIFSEVNEKPALDKNMFSDDEDDETEKEVESLLKDRDISHIGHNK